MRLFWRYILLMPLAATILPAEILLPMYYIAPSIGAGITVYVVAAALSISQMLYQYWGLGKVEELAPATTVRIGGWLRKQPLVQAVRRRETLTLFLLAALPGVRSFGVALWQTSGSRLGGWVLAAGTLVQLGCNFAFMLGLGQAIRALFQ